MHEMALTESIVEIALEEARKQGARQVTRVFLDVGALSASSPRRSNSASRRSPPAPPPRARSWKSSASPAPAGASIAKEACRSPSASAPARNAAAYRVQMTAGDELKVREMEID